MDSFIARIIDHNVWMYMYTPVAVSEFNWYVYNETFLVSRQGHNDSNHDYVCIVLAMQYCVI